MNTTQAQYLTMLEQSLVGAILLDAAVLDTLPPIGPEHFADLRAKAVWSAYESLRKVSAPIDLRTVEDQLRQDGMLDSVGLAFLGECAYHVPTAESAGHYALMVRDAALHRATLCAVADLLERARDGSSTGTELLDEAMRSFTKLDADEVRADSDGIRVLIRARIESLKTKLDNAGEMTGVPTGVVGLDSQIGGWQRGIVSIIAARPGHGKSSLGLATTDACSKAGIGVHVFSLEDTRDSYCDRVLSRASEMPADDLRRMKFTREQLNNFTFAHADLNKRGHWLVDDRSGIGADDIVRSVRRHRRENNTQVVIVDYLQLLKRNRDASSSHESIGANLHVLADAAKNDNMAYVVMSQLNRGVEARVDKRPQISDMRESGTIEERAKCVVGLYRGAFYGPPQREVDEDEHGCLMSEARLAATAQLLILKNSNGVAPARILANWHGPTTRIW